MPNPFERPSCFFFLSFYTAFFLHTSTFGVHISAFLNNTHIPNARKCRRFYVSHRGHNCPNDFPDGATYVPLSEDVAVDAMRKVAVASTYNGGSTDSSTSRNAHIPYPQNQHHECQQALPSSSFSNAYSSFFAPPAISYSTPAPSVNDTSPAQIEEVPNNAPDIFMNPPAPVSAILSSSSYQSFVLVGDSDTSGSSEDVSPISVPHLIWKAQIWNNDDVQMPYDCLLDDGAHLVLIIPETITDLGLPIRRLSEPVCITLALNKTNDMLHTSRLFLIHFKTLPPLSAVNGAHKKRTS